MKKVDKRIYRFTSGLLIGLLGILSFSCVEEENGELFEMNGFIAGFDYCSFHSNGRVGYVIISNDLSDTISTYSLSPDRLSLPSPVGLNPNRPIFTIPEEAFYQEGIVRSREVLTQNFPIKVIYRPATQEDKQRYFFVCIGTLSTASFAQGIWDKKQAIIVKASRN
jgi:hypothetical protein